MKIRIKIPSITVIGYLLFFIYCLFSDLFETLFGSGFRLLFWGIVLVMLVFGTREKISISRNTLFVILLISVLFLYQNKGIANGSYMTIVKFYFFLIVALVVRKSTEHYESIVKIIARLGLIHVFATFLFFLVPSLYNVMYKIWGYWPSGTGLGRNGYKAALSDHYSGNGVVIAITYLVLFAFVLANTKLDSRKKRAASIILFLLAFFAVILTTKRAHLLFGVVAMLFVYYFCNPNKLKSRTFKILVALLILVPIVIVLSNNVTIIKDTLERFQDMDEDSHMVSRYRFWLLAIQMFSNSPIMGNGWMSFRYEFAKYFYTGRRNQLMYMNAHNIYLQLLAEVGIVGILVFLVLIVYLLYTVFRILRMYNRQQYVDKKSMVPLYFAALFLVFFIQYGLTGNCLYDRVQPVFFVTIGMILGYKDQYKKKCEQEHKKVLADGLCPK